MLLTVNGLKEIQNLLSITFNSAKPKKEKIVTNTW